MSKILSSSSGRFCDVIIDKSKLQIAVKNIQW